MTNENFEIEGDNVTALELNNGIPKVHDSLGDESCIVEMVGYPEGAHFQELNSSEPFSIDQASQEVKKIIAIANEFAEVNKKYKGVTENVAKLTDRLILCLWNLLRHNGLKVLGMKNWNSFYKKWLMKRIV